MMNEQVYAWVKITRDIILSQCSQLTVDELNKEFNIGLKSIKHTLVHIAGCYHAWLGSFILRNTDTPLFSLQQINDLNFDDILSYFEQADAYVDQILNFSHHDLSEIVLKQVPWKQDDTCHENSAYQLFVHSVTHEFHHKGQIVSMLRLLGYEVESTDILNIR